MSADRRLKIVLCWHMHQPQYQNMIGGEYLQPWTYLHAIKDYVDMAAHLEAEPAARAVVNFAPTLLDQLADYRAYHVKGGRLACFFRDDGLSDLVGFTYSDCHADDAVANLLHHLEAIADSSADDDRQAVVSIILDGENAWEHYPNNGFYFLSALYRQLSGSSRLNLTTFSACLAEGGETRPLQQLVAGSWVYGTFSTWMGDPDKNRAWDMLIDAKHVFDRVQAQGDLDAAQRRAAQRQLAICEGSDWFWWFGDYNPSHSVHDFDRLYRMHLSNLYQLLHEEPPDYLAHSFSHGSDSSTQEAGGVMRHGQPAA